MPAVCGQFEIGESAGQRGMLEAWTTRQRPRSAAELGAVGIISVQRLSGGMITDVWLISYADGSRIIAWSTVAWFQWVRCRPAPLSGGSRWSAVSAGAGLGRGLHAVIGWPGAGRLVLGG
jgi:hypothetical protein